MILPIVTLVAVFINLILGLFVLQKNSKSATNRLFFLLCAAILLWTVFNYFSLRPIGDSEIIYWLRAHMVSAVLVAASFVLFIYNFPHAGFTFRKRVFSLYMILVVLAAVVTATSWVFQSATELSDGQVKTEVGPLIPLFGIVAFGSVLAGIIIVVQRFRHSRGKLRDQLRYMLLGTSLMFGLVFLLIFIPIVVFNNTTFAPYLPIITFPFVACVTYAIVRHSLLDIRLVVARSVAYTLTVSILLVSYVAAALYVGRLFYQGEMLSGQIAVYGILAVFVAATFQPLRSRLDQVTENMFFKGGYNTSELVRQVTEIMAKTLHLGDLSRQSLEIIISTIQVSKGSFWVLEDGEFYCFASQGMINKDIQYYTHNQAYLQSLCDDKSCPVLLKADGSKELKKMKMEVAVPLFAGDELQGFLLLGEKQSGEVYSQQDIHALSILGPSLAISLENARSYKQISEFNQTLEQEVDKATRDLTVANDKLSRSNAKLRQLDSLKDEFISITSHELRTPLTAIRGYLWMAMHGKAQDQKTQDEYMDRAYTSTERLIALVNDSLDISRIDSGRVQLSPLPTDIYALAKEVATDLMPRATQQGQVLEVRRPVKALPAVMVDPEKLYQVLTNLVGNALKFTPSNGEISVSFAVEGEKVVASVKDSGPGIDDDDKKRLFQKFSRLDASATVPGTGLGLFLCKEIIHLSKGRIWVESKPGGGSNFRFTLPMTKSQAVKAEDRTQHPQRLMVA